MKTISFRVSGRVQGVSFRAFAAWLAQNLELQGWIRNCRDGSVEGLVCGHEEDLEEFFTGLQEGPPLARVDELSAAEVETEESLAGFLVRPTT